MTKTKKEYFTSRWGFILSMMGVAVGAGNIWRFSRIVAQNGGGSFLIPWVIFLFIWSIPLIIAEIAMGKQVRKGPIGALATIGGKKMGWMGGFIAVVTTGILFYYSVVVGWGFSYFFYAITGVLNHSPDYRLLWENYSTGFMPLIFHLISISIGAFVVFKGIVKGIEKSNLILMPTLLFIIVIILIRAITLPGAWEGIHYLFTPKFSDLLNYKVWMEALTQNAWDTGAGWGLLLVYACYAKPKESITINGAFIALANNAVSLIMGATIFATAFAINQGNGIQSLIGGQGSTNTGLTFIYLPELFHHLPGGIWIHTLFSSIFFLAFSFAALSSMISMVQLTVQVLNELGISKNKAIWITALLAFLLGAPSALSKNIFENQDWVWSLGLVVSGLFIAVSIIKYGVDRYRCEIINSTLHDLKLGKFYNSIIGLLIPIQAVILLFWYFYQSITKLDTTIWWNPFRPYSVGTVIFQWGICLIALAFLNKVLVKRTLESK